MERIKIFENNEAIQNAINTLLLFEDLLRTIKRNFEADHIQFNTNSIKQFFKFGLSFIKDQIEKRFENEYKGHNLKQAKIDFKKHHSEIIEPYNGLYTQLTAFIIRENIPLNFIEISENGTIDLSNIKKDIKEKNTVYITPDKKQAWEKLNQFAKNFNELEESLSKEFNHSLFLGGNLNDQRLKRILKFSTNKDKIYHSETGNIRIEPDPLFFKN